LAGKDVRYQVTFSMVELYMEEAFDLLTPIKSKALRVREKPTEGKFFVENLSHIPVASYAEVCGVAEAGVFD
jgi:hypothetical protein